MAELPRSETRRGSRLAIIRFQQFPTVKGEAITAVYLMSWMIFLPCLLPLELAFEPYLMPRTRNGHGARDMEA
jgi:hypothetical protein